VSGRPAVAAVINSLGNVPLVGRVLRAYARRFPEGSVVEIRSGLAAGLLWKRHHRYVSGYWIGNYELPIQEALARLLASGNVFYDIGANAGFFTLLASRLVGPKGRVFAIEPMPENVASVREQIEVNGLANVEVIEAAAGAQAGMATLHVPGGNNSMAHLGEARGAEASLQVKIVTLDDFVREHPAPSVLKIDVEGAEDSVLAGSTAVIATRPRFLIELHGLDCGKAVTERLGRAGYRFEDLAGRPVASPAELLHVVALANGGP
jgi:FkbM family methyltransferase